MSEHTYKNLYDAKFIGSARCDGGKYIHDIPRCEVEDCDEPAVYLWYTKDIDNFYLCSIHRKEASDEHNKAREDSK